MALPVEGAIKIAVLDFELKDLTLAPNSPEEIERAASLKPRLESILAGRSDYAIVAIPRSHQENADLATGYLFDHSDAAASLGRAHGADYVLVGRVHKASMLFVYFMLHMVETRTERLVGNYICEVKGPQNKLTVSGLECLVEQIHKTFPSD